MSQGCRARSLACRYAVAGLALIAAVPRAAHAQGTAASAPARVTVDIPARPLTIGARVDVTRDSNVVQGSSEAARLRGLEKAEAVTTPSATLDYGHNDGRFGIALSGVFGYDFHSRNQILDRERIDFAGTATVLIGSSCSATGKILYLRKQTRQQDLTTIVTDNTVKITIATLGETCISPGGLIQNVQLLQSSWHNSSVLNINNDRKAISGLLGYTDPGFGTAGVTALYEETDFFGRPAILVMTPDTLEKTQIGLQYTSPSDRRLTGSLSVGYVYSRARISSGSRLAGKLVREGLVAQASVAYKASDRLRINALAARRIRHDTSFTITTDVQLGVDYSLSPKVRAGIGGRWLRDVYYGRDVTLPRIAQDWQNQTTLYGTLTLLVAPRTSIAADARYDEGRADFSPFDYRGSRFTLTLISTLGNSSR
jgi:hypothetical protein